MLFFLTFYSSMNPEKRITVLKKTKQKTNIYIYIYIYRKIDR